MKMVKKISKRSAITNGPVGSISIIIDKSDYELSVYDDKGWYATYPVVFGNNSLEDKKIEVIKTHLKEVSALPVRKYMKNGIASWR